MDPDGLKPITVGEVSRAIKNRLKELNDRKLNIEEEKDEEFNSRGIHSTKRFLINFLVPVDPTAELEESIAEEYKPILKPLIDEIKLLSDENKKLINFPENKILNGEAAKKITKLLPGINQAPSTSPKPTTPDEDDGLIELGDGESIL